MCKSEQVRALARAWPREINQSIIVEIEENTYTNAQAQYVIKQAFRKTDIYF